MAISATGVVADGGPPPPSDDTGDDRRRVAPQERLPRWLPWLAAEAGTAVLVACVAALAVGRSRTGDPTFWNDRVFHLAALGPIALVGSRAVCDRRLRTGWVLVAGGLVANEAGELASRVNGRGATVSFASLWFLLAYGLWAGAIFWIGRHHRSTLRRSALFDACITAMTLASLTVALCFRTVVDSSSTMSEVAVGMSYPLLDVVLIALLVATIAPAPFRPPPAMLALLVGVGVLLVADVVDLHGVSPEVLRQLGPLALGLAAWLRTTTVPSLEPDDAVSLGIVAPGAAFVALGIVTMALGTSISPLASAVAVVAVGLVLVRVLWTLREFRRIHDSFRQARTDDLTGLGNRRFFMEGVERVLADHNSGASVLMIDLDGFKEVNDSLGHPAGDQLLVEVGARFARALPTDLILARLGGDEYGVAGLMGGPMARLLAADLVAAIEEPIVIEGIAVRITASIGIATLPGGVDRAELLRMADVAMYDAKRNERTIGEYSPDLDPNGRERLALLASLGTAIEERAFTMHYQPVIEASSGRVVGMEALIRWEHPELGLLYPDDFIPLAEQSGLISRITRAVIDQAIGFLATVRAQGFDIGLSINLSGKDLVDEGMPQHVMAAVARHRVPHQSITVEITETAVASDLERSSRTLLALQTAGLRVSIDDFGVGSSSLSQLIAMPVDELKLDRSFVAALDSDRRAEAILRSTVELGRTLGLTVVAEGVETAASLEVVRQHGVTLLQGFLLAPPLPPHELLGFLTRAAVGTEVLAPGCVTAPVAEPVSGGR